MPPPVERVCGGILNDSNELIDERGELGEVHDDDQKIDVFSAGRLFLFRGKLAWPTMGHAISKNCCDRETSAFNKTRIASMRMRGGRSSC